MFAKGGNMKMIVLNLLIFFTGISCFRQRKDNIDEFAQIASRLSRNLISDAPVSSDGSDVDNFYDHSRPMSSDFSTDGAMEFEQDDEGNSDSPVEEGCPIFERDGEASADKKDEQEESFVATSEDDNERAERKAEDRKNSVSDIESVYSSKAGTGSSELRNRTAGKSANSNLTEIIQSATFDSGSSSRKVENETNSKEK